MKLRKFLGSFLHFIILLSDILNNHRHISKSFFYIFIDQLRIFVISSLLKINTLLQNTYHILLILLNQFRLSQLQIPIQLLIQSLQLTTFHLESLHCLNDLSGSVKLFNVVVFKSKKIFLFRIFDFFDHFQIFPFADKNFKNFAV